MWPWRRRRPPRRTSGPPPGNGREAAALAALRQTRRATAVTEQVAQTGELLAEHVRNALRGFG